MTAGVQGTQPQHMPSWHIDYFDMYALENIKIEKDTL